MNIHDMMTVAEARVIVMERRWDKEGLRCPCCEQQAKVYKRSITGSMAKVLCVMYWRGKDKVHHLPTLFRENAAMLGTAGQGGDWAKLRFWKLLERLEEDRGDGSKRCGLAWLTEAGVNFVHDRLRVAKYAYVYDDECIGYDGDKMVGITDVLPKKFNYQAILDTEGISL